MTAADLYNLMQWLFFPLFSALCWYAYATQKELTAFKLKVAEEYATKEFIKETEERLVLALQRIDDKLDRALNLAPRAR
jgi:hypothetical protein